MPGPAVIFRDIHRLRRFARDLQEQLDRIPRQLNAHQAKVTRQEELQRECLDAIKKLKVTAHEKEVSLKTTHGQIARHQKQLETAGSKKEYDALQLEIKHDREKCQALEDEVLAAMAEGEDKAAQLPELDKGVRQAREEYARYEQEAGRRRDELKSQLDETLGQLKEVEAHIPAELLPQYNRIVAAMGADAKSAVQGRTCSACYTEITAQNINDLHQERFVGCKSCGRILYLPEAAPARADEGE